MRPIYYLSGYCNGALPPTPPPLGRGMPLPERKAARGKQESAKLARLPWAIEKRGLDPKVVAAEGEDESAEAPPPANYQDALQRMRAKGIVT